MRSCPECGIAAGGGVRFCPGCGAAIDAAAGPPPPPPPPPEAPGRDTRRVWWVGGAVLAIVALVVGLAVGLGGNSSPPAAGDTSADGGGAATTGPDGPDPAAPPGVAPPAPGEVAVYFTASTGSSSEYVAEYDITLESSRGAVFRFLPAANELTIVSEYNSASYAEAVKFPLTFDGRLFVVRHGKGPRTSDFNELDPADHQNLNSLYLADSYNRTTMYALVGDRVLWRSYREYDALSGYTGGDIYSMAFGGQRELVLANDAAGNLGELHSAGGRLYRAHLDPDTDLLSVAAADPATAAGTDLLFVLDLAPLGAGSWNFAVDEEAFWAAATLGDDSGGPATVHLYRRPWDAPVEAGADLVYQVEPADPGDFCIALDVDLGRALIALAGQSDESFIVYDHATGTGTVYALGLYTFHSQILVGR